MPVKVYSESDGITASGRAVEGGYQETDITFLGILTNASQNEIDQWKQNGHPITHKVTQYGAMGKAKPTDYLVLNDREFYVQGVKNPGNLNVTMLYYVEERYDLRKGLK